MSTEVKYGVAVDIMRFADSTFPGFVELQLVDAAGRAWRFVEKVPMVTTENLTAASTYPRQCIIACEVLSRRGPSGSTAVIDTSSPWGLKSVDGNSQFVVATTQVMSMTGAA